MPLDGCTLNTSRRKTFILGFKTAAASYIGIENYIFENFPESKYLLSYKLGQDHIETLFSKIRSKGGFNNNPDVITFKSSLKALLVKADITPSPNANCLDFDESSDGSCFLLLSCKRRKRPVEGEEQFDSPEKEVEHLKIDLSKPITDIVEYISK